MGSNFAASSATRWNQASQVGSSVTPSEPMALLRKRGSTRAFRRSPGGNKARAKKYRCGKALGLVHAAAALEAASDLSAPRRLRNMGARARRRGAGRSFAVCANLFKRGTSEKVELPAKSSSPPNPQRENFNPAWRAAQETK